MRTCRALHLPVSQAAQPRISATTTESTIGGGPKYKKLSTTPGNCRIKNAQPMKPAAVGVERANCPRCHDRRSEEHTSELQSRLHLVCRLLLEKKKKLRTKASSLLVRR